MSAVLKNIHANNAANSDGPQNLLEKFKGRRSEELIIAFAGPIGCGIASIVDGVEERLKERGYVDVVRIKLSDFLESALSKSFIADWKLKEKVSARYTRYRRLQEAGKELRKQTKNPAILAEYAAQQIAIHRLKRSSNSTSETQEEGPIVPDRVAYLIDQVKRPEEVALLRAVYRNMFYLAGVTRIHERRVSALEAELVEPVEIQDLMRIDRYEEGDDGQQLDKTLHLADYFMRNDALTTDEKRTKLNRFLDLVHGDKSVTPKDAEHGMYAAYCAGLRSACLSRQVGAAIATPTGEILSTGCNDVPKAGGGLYTASADVPDMRCIHLDGQQCFNDLHKRRLQAEIGKVLDKALTSETTGELLISTKKKAALLDSIYRETSVGALIEFSRSVHAEMDAIVGLARLGGTGLADSILYTTTFPCHSCARHIVAAGIAKVFYIEPYEKSLAKDLHKDAIAFDVEETKDHKPNRVEFLHYEGVAPTQFQNMFKAGNRKNKEGKFLPIKIQEASKVLPEYLDNYQDFEKKAVLNLTEEIRKLSENKAI